MVFARRISCLFLFVIFLTACGGGSEAEPTTDVDFVLTSGVGTMVASFFGTQTALYTPPVATNTPPVATSTPIPLPSPIDTPTLAPIFVPSSTPLTIYYTATLNTSIPSPTGTIYTATTDPSSLAIGCNNLALIYDVTIPNGTTFTLERSSLKPGRWKIMAPVIGNIPIGSHFPVGINSAGWTGGLRRQSSQENGQKYLLSWKRLNQKELIPGTGVWQIQKEICLALLCLFPSK